MDPLSTIEDIIGNIDTWPTYVIHDMFVETPSIKIVKTVAAFMCGNGIPCELAIDCLNACNGLKKSAVAAFINQYYAEWDSLPYRTHGTQYWFIFYKRWQWTNGEPVHLLQAMFPVNKFGIENTGCPLLIRTTINHVRSRTNN